MSKTFILIAEDDADDRSILQEAFASKGFTDPPEFVENGVELMTYLNNFQKNAIGEDRLFILLDLNMPKKDGREALKEIKQHPVFKKIPVIVFTTATDVKEIKRCYELGANSYIIKPNSYGELLDIIDDIKNYWFETASLPV